MGFFSFLLGTGEFKKQKLSIEEVPLSLEEIQKLVSRFKIKSLDAGEEKLVEQAIAYRRLNDRKISLRQIDEILGQLVLKGKISRFDRKSLVSVFDEHFKKKQVDALKNDSGERDSSLRSE